MVKAEVIAKVAMATGMPKNTVAKVLNSFVEVVKDALSNGEEVKIMRFGKFVVVRVKESMRTNPRTGDKLTVPAHNVVRFRPSSALKDAVN